MSHENCPDNPCPGYFPYCEDPSARVSAEDLKELQTRFFGTQWTGAINAATKELEQARALLEEAKEARVEALRQRLSETEQQLALTSALLADEQAHRAELADQLTTTANEFHRVRGRLERELEAKRLELTQVEMERARLRRTLDAIGAGLEVEVTT
jgi:chromosome segregation ATPase